MEDHSRERQQSFIEHIARKLGRSVPLKEAPLHMHRGAPDFWREHELTKEERAEQFIDNWRKAGGEAERVPDFDAAKAYIVDVLTRMKARNVLRQHQPEWDRMKLEEALPEMTFDVWDDSSSSEQRLAVAAAADVGLAVADHAVSVTGSIVLTSSAERGRSVSLLPTALVALIPIEVLHTRIGGVTDWIEAQDKKSLPAGIHFISGPSRSADIENDLTIGVHGPGVVYALIIG